MLLNAAVKRFVYIKKKKLVCIVAYLFILYWKETKKLNNAGEYLCDLSGQNQKT